MIRLVEPYPWPEGDFTARQDFVDNAVFALIQKVNPTNRLIDWDIEMIGEIRDVLVCRISQKTGVNERVIYP